MGDFTGNGKIDLAVSDDVLVGGVYTGAVSVLLGNGAGGFSSPINYPGGGSSMVVGDFTGDGNLDVAAASTNLIELLVGNGTGGFGPPSFYLTGGGYNSNPIYGTIAVGDFDGNGPDLAVVNTGDGTVSILLDQAIASSFQVSAPFAVYEGTPFVVTVTALNHQGNPAAGYTGTVHFTSTDSQAILPPDATLTNGTGTFSVTLNSAGSETLTATDSANSVVLGSIAISVLPIAPSQFSVAVPTNTTAGKSFVIVVTALDQAGYVTNGFVDTIQFTSSDGQAPLPIDSTLTNGIGFFAVVLKTAGNQTITVSDTTNPGITGTSAAIAVSAAAPNQFAVTLPTSAVTGSPVSFTVTAEDAFGNATPSFTGTIQFTSSDRAATLPASAPLTAGVGNSAPPSKRQPPAHRASRGCKTSP